ncbi:hypothetical protein [Streptomyces sp. ODS28]|uniref:hypothetical protein n=1 Tax=Streptomyces sp. ODS28 TaxID=3136688 RepID=UPI0031F1900D
MITEPIKVPNTATAAASTTSIHPADHGRRAAGIGRCAQLAGILLEDAERLRAQPPKPTTYGELAARDSEWNETYLANRASLISAPP